MEVEGLKALQGSKLLRGGIDPGHFFVSILAQVFVSIIWDELTVYLVEFRIKLQRGSFLHNQ